MRDLKQQLFGEHEQIEYSLQYLAGAVRSGARRALLRECWVRFELSLLDHLAAEERYLFGVVAEAHRAGIEALRAEHLQIRQALAELGLSVDLGTMNIQEIEALRTLLAAHSAHESYSLYQWLEESPSCAAQRAVSAGLETRASACADRVRSVTVPAIPSLMRAAHAR